MKKFKLIDPDNIPGIDYYLDALKEPGNDYPKRPNHFGSLTIEGFVKAANAIAEPFGKAWKKSTEIMYGKRKGNRRKTN